MQIELDSQSSRCVICASPRLRRFVAHASDTTEPALVSISECKDCCFAWQYPLGRTAQESVEHFDENYRSQGKRLSNYFNPQVKRNIASHEFDFVAQLPIEGRRLLDLGAGAGIFAEVAAEHGWSVTALDPALDQAHLAGNKAVKAIRGTMEALSDEERFDVVTLWDVIEHMTSPVTTIADASARIKQGGWIVIETGNYRSADRVEGGDRHWMYQVDHRWYFSPESMTSILKQLGFSDFVYSQKTLRPGWNGRADYPGPSYVRLLKSVVKNPLKAPRHAAMFRNLRRAADWPMAGIGIFTLAARKADAVPVERAS